MRNQQNKTACTEIHWNCHYNFLEQQTLSVSEKPSKGGITQSLNKALLLISFSLNSISYHLSPFVQQFWINLSPLPIPQCISVLTFLENPAYPVELPEIKWNSIRVHKVYQSTVITVHVIMSLNSYQVVLWTNAGEKEQLRQSYSFIKKTFLTAS